MRNFGATVVGLIYNAFRYTKTAIFEALSRRESRQNQAAANIFRPNRQASRKSASAG